MKHGKFIVIEGIDRSGKTTLAENLLLKLKKCYPETQPIGINYPDRQTEIGKIINKYLSKEIELNANVSHLLFSANRWEKDKKIRSLVETHVVISTRYYFSGIAYSNAALGLDNEWTEYPDKGLLKPDLLIFVDIEPSLTSKRKDFGTEIYDNVYIQRKIHIELKKQCLKFENCIVVDGTNDIDKLTDEAFNFIQKLLD